MKIILNMILDMKNRINNFFKILVSSFLGILFLFLSLQEFDYNLFKKFLININFFFLIASVLLLILLIFLRAVRWNFLFDSPIEINNLYKSQLVGYMGNNILPLRLGELLKAYFLEKKTKIPKFKIIGTIVFERVLDLLGLIILFVILFNFSIFNIFPYQYVKIIFLILIFTTFLIILSFNINRIKSLRFKKKYFLFLNDIIDGFSSINRKNFLFSVVYTLLIWISYIIVVYLVQESMSLNLSFIQCIIILLISSIALMVPSLPGNIGTFEGSIVYTLLLFGIEDGFGFAFILHAVSFIPYTLLGLFYLIEQRNS